MNEVRVQPDDDLITVIHLVVKSLWNTKSKLNKFANEIEQAEEVCLDCPHDKFQCGRNEEGCKLAPMWHQLITQYVTIKMEE